MENLELFYYYTNVVSLTLSERPEIQRIWQMTIPKEAVSHSALMHGLLALSALHLHHSSDASQNRRKYVALVHFDHALTSLRQLIGNMTPENCDILIALSMLVAIFAFALPQPTNAATEVLINHISETSKLERGVYVFLGNARQWILQGRLGLLGRLRVFSSSASLSEDVDTAYKRLEFWNDNSSNIENTKSVYALAIQTLRANFFAVDSIPDDPGIRHLWLVTVEPEYMKLLESQESMALSILAHYAVILQSEREKWWSKDWGYQLVATVYRLLDARWHHLIGWATQQVGMVDTFLIERSFRKQ